MRIKVSDLREIEKLILQEKISYSRGVEMLNEITEEGVKTVTCTDCGKRYTYPFGQYKHDHQ